jgi:hypothetical protein
MPNLRDKSDKEIDQWIKNHEGGGATEHALYFDLLEERARRAQADHALEIERSLDELKRAAVAQKCISYGDLAKASNLE